MVALTSHSIIEAKPEPLAAPMADGLVLLQVESDRYFNLNDLGREIWQAIQTPVSVTELVTQITSTHEVDPDQAEADVLALLQDMARAQLITVQ